MLSKINRNLKLIKQNPKDDFGGLNIVLYGDPCQLKPIGDKPIFEYNAKDPCGVIAGQSLFDQFQSYELTDIMRQSDLVLQSALSDLADASTPMSAKNVELFKSIVKEEKDLDIDPDKRIDLFAFNTDVNAHNETMIEKLSGKAYTVIAELSIMGDTLKSVKDKVLQAILERNDHKETVGLRLSVNFKVDG